MVVVVVVVVAATIEVVVGVAVVSVALVVTIFVVDGETKAACGYIQVPRESRVLHSSKVHTGSAAHAWGQHLCMSFFHDEQYLVLEAQV